MLATIDNIDYKIGVHNYVFMNIEDRWIKSSLTASDLQERIKANKEKEDKRKEKIRGDNEVQAIRNTIPEELKGFIVYSKRNKTFSVKAWTGKKKIKIGEATTVTKAIIMHHKAVDSRKTSKQANYKAKLAGYKSLTELANLAGVTTRTLHLWNKKKPEFFKQVLNQFNNQKV